MQSGQKKKFEQQKHAHQQLYAHRKGSNSTKYLGSLNFSALQISKYSLNSILALTRSHCNSVK